MRYTLSFALCLLFFTACNKDKYTTAPQIRYKSLIPNLVNKNLVFQAMPVLKIEVTDAEGDLGLTRSDTARIFIKNLVTGKIDSTLMLPDLSGAANKNFKGDIDINFDTNIILEGTTRPSPKTDTIRYEIYIKDFAKNKSNVLTIPDPLFVKTL
jgi:hypothetical protein